MVALALEWTATIRPSPDLKYCFPERFLDGEVAQPGLLLHFANDRGLWSFSHFNQ
jgi:hypothetical protein